MARETFEQLFTNEDLDISHDSENSDELLMDLDESDISSPIQHDFQA